MSACTDGYVRVAAITVGEGGIDDGHVSHTRDRRWTDYLVGDLRGAAQRLRWLRRGGGLSGGERRLAIRHHDAHVRVDQPPSPVAPGSGASVLGRDPALAPVWGLDVLPGGAVGGGVGADH